ncbi:MAG TPA: signal peptide peptidase SppA [Streptosporangiaceae bacterium]|jgi:protease-4
MADAKLTDMAGKAGLASVSDRVGQLSRRWKTPIVLELDLTEGLAEEPPGDPVSAVLGRHRARLDDVLDGLRRARDDDRVRALLVRIGGRRLGLGLVQELRDAVSEFGRGGKLTVAWSETFGDFSAGNVPYYLATAFGRIVLQPSGDLGLTGIAVEQFFLRSAMDRLGVDYQVAKRREYKSAADMMTEREFTGPAREATQRLAGSIAGQLTDAIAARLGGSTDEARELIDRGPFLAAEALELGLVDALGYRDEAYRWVRRRAGREATLQPLARYRRAHALTSRMRKMPSPREPFVALVHATGPIRSGRGGRGPLSGAMGADTVAAALRAAAADERARAILLRVNSPGGSYVASDTIWREVVRARARGKPVVVSMGNVAASGGYFIAMAADVIVAQPGTVTGSIGVITAKPVLSGLLDRAGITTDSVAEGAHATMFAPTRPFSEDEWAKVNAWLDRIYADFTGKVAAGRRLTPAHVEEVARGRVWTGADALDRGLVDELGGLDTAAGHARRRAGLAEDAPVRLFPRPGPLDRLRPPGAGEFAAGLAQSWLAESGLAGSWLTQSWLAEAWGPVAALASRGGFPAAGPLLLQGAWTIS